MTGVSFGYGTGSTLTAAQWAALFAQCYPAGNVSTYSATLLAGSTQAAWFTALGLPSAAPGFANGLATLDGTGKVPVAQLPASVVGALEYQGTWNASTNSPALASGVGTKGFYYKVSTLGTTTVDGCSSWGVGDMIVFNGVTWDKIDGQVTQIPSAQISDSTSYGRALLTGASVLAQRAALNVDQATAVADANQTMTNAMESVAWTSLTAPRTGTLPAASTMNVGQTIFIFDESGACSQNIPITINRAGSDTINGGTSYVLNSAYAGVALTRVSSTKWTAIAVSAPPTDAVGFRNRIINGDMRIDQRNAGASQVIVAGAGVYTVDRFLAYCTGANVSGQRVAGSPPDQYLYQFTGAASVTAISLIQRIEAANSSDLAGTTAMLSVKLANSTLTTVAWAAYYANAADVFATKTLIASGSFTVNSTLARYQVPISVPAAATTGIEIDFSVGAQTSGTWQIADVQLEPGSYATAFERLPFGLSVALCERYYQQSYDLGVVAGTATNSGCVTHYVEATTSFATLPVAFRQRMRGTPTLTLYSPVSGAVGQIRDFNGAVDVAALSASIGQAGFYAYANNVSITGGRYTSVHYTAASEL